MFVMGNLLTAVASVLHMLLQAYIIVVIVRALISWVNPDPSNFIVQVLHGVTDPLLNPIRRWLFSFLGYRGMMIDFSPLILILAIYFVDIFVVATLQDIGWRLR